MGKSIATIRGILSLNEKIEWHGSMYFPRIIGNRHVATAHVCRNGRYQKTCGYGKTQLIAYRRLLDKIRNSRKHNELPEGK